MVNPPQSNHTDGFSPSVLRSEFSPTLFIGTFLNWNLYLCLWDRAVFQPHSSFPSTSVYRLWSSQPPSLLWTRSVHCKGIFHSKAYFLNVLGIFLHHLEILFSFQCSPWRVQSCRGLQGCSHQVMKPSHTCRLGLFKCLWVSCGHKKLSEEVRSGDLSWFLLCLLSLHYSVLLTVLRGFV